jgi:hypothetical protein
VLLWSLSSQLTLYDAVEEPDIEGYQMQPKLQAANSSPTESEVLLMTTNVNPEGTSELGKFN